MSLASKEVYCQKFRFFGRLPVELRNAIWQIAIYDIKPRVVRFNDGIALKTRRKTHIRKEQLLSTSYIPGLLHACHESRNLAMKRWNLSFSVGKEPAKIFFDFSSDIVFIPHNFDLRHFADKVDRGSALSLIRLAINIMGVKNYNYDLDSRFVINLVKDFPSLSRLYFPEIDLDAMSAESSERRHLRWNEVQSRPLKRRRKQRQAKPGAQKRVIQLSMIDPVHRPTEPYIQSRMNLWELACRTFKQPYPKTERVDYCTVDLGLVEYDEDQERLDQAEASRQA
jgi:hypothetical protein